MTNSVSHKGSEGSAGKGVFRALRAYFDHNRLGDILVLTGRLSEQALREALALQKLSGHPLGQVLIRHGYIRRFDLYSALFTQRGVRGMAALVAICAAISMFQPRGARAESNNGLSGSFQLAAARGDIGQVSSYPHLFGSDEKRSSDTSAFTKWTAMFNRFEHDMNDSAHNATMHKWKSEIVGLRGLPLEEMAIKVNAMMNDVRYVRDTRNYGRSDFWATPVEFMERGGDCEDYAIAKYISLRALGVPESRMRIAIVHDRQQNTPHAVLVVYTDTKALVLDNQNQFVKDASEIKHYKPIFSLNRSGWWLHRSQGATMLASAR